MSPEEFAKMFADFYEEMIEDADSKDYEINDIQWKRLMDIVEVFYSVAEPEDKVYPVKLIPQRIVGGATAEFILFHVYGESLIHFCEVLKHASAFSLDATTSGRVVMSVTVPNVFKKKAT